MSSQTPAREASHRGDESTNPSQTPVARSLDTPSPSHAVPPSPSDSKRSNAAQLARELGSSSPWSETLMPHTYGTPTRSIEPSRDPAIVQESEDLYHNTPQVEQDLDPPPAYTRTVLPNNTTRPIRDSSTEVASNSNTSGPVTTDAHIAQPSSSADDEQGHRMQQAEPDVDVETPLLTRSSPTQISGLYSRWMQRRKLRKQRNRRIFCAVLFFALLASVLVGFLVGHHQGTSWFRRPSTKHGQPFVDTGHDYVRHETTQDIYGAYRLWDRLVLTTKTGVIDVEIDPQPGNDPAVLYLSSDVGSVTVRIADTYLRRRKRAQRTIYTEIHSLTGTICAEILLGYGGYATVETTTGVQTLSILTSGVGPKDEISNLTTTSGTGTQKVVLTSLDSVHIPVSNIRGLHQSYATASLDISYSPAWVGRVHAAASAFGLVTVTGDDLKYTEMEKHEVVAYRGSGQNLTLTELMSGGTGSATFRSSKRDGTGSVLLTP